MQETPHQNRFDHLIRYRKPAILGNGMRARSRSLLDLINFKLKLSGSFELNVKIAAHFIEARAVFLQDLAALVQEVDDAIEFVS